MPENWNELNLILKLRALDRLWAQSSKRWTSPLLLFLIGLLKKKLKLNCMGGRCVQGRALLPRFAGLHS